MEMKRLMEEAEAFICQFYEECGFSDIEDRLREVRQEIADTGTYIHSQEELLFGARLAWRNRTVVLGGFIGNLCKLPIAAGRHPPKASAKHYLPILTKPLTVAASYPISLFLLQRMPMEMLHCVFGMLNSFVMQLTGRTIELLVIQTSLPLRIDARSWAGSEKEQLLIYFQ